MTSAAEQERKRANVASPRPQRDVVFLSVALLTLSGLLFYSIPDAADPVRDGGLWLLLAIGILFVATELSVFHFEFKREAIAFSLSEVPLAFALVFLTPGPTLAARLLGTLIVSLTLRRRAPYKVVFNVAVYTVEISLAFLLLRSLVPIWGSTDPALVLAVITAVAVPSFVSSIFVSVAISRFEGGLTDRIMADVRVAWWLFVVNGTIAGMTVGLGLVSPGLAVFALVPVAALWYLLKAYGVIDQRLRDLDAVHGFTARVGRSLDPYEVSEAAVEEVAQLMRAEHVGLTVFGIDEPFAAGNFATVGLRLPATADDPAWRSLVAERQSQLLDRRALPPAIAPADHRFNDFLIAPVDDGSEPLGVMALTGRLGPVGKFAPQDVARVQGLTEQLAASLRKAMLHQRIEREARIDALTGLPNRASFERTVEAAAEDHADDDRLFVAVLDLDRFKEVNDTLGHQAGDSLLVEVAHRIERCIGTDRVLARLAGDEFAILGTAHDEDAISRLIQTCVAEVGRPVVLDGLEIVVTASAGVATVDVEAPEAAIALRHADIAMQNAKSQRLGVDLYRDEIDRRTPARLSMLGDLRAAIEDNQLHVNYQPKLDLSSGMVIGAEALVRWTHPVRGAVSPGQFVRIAEETGLIKQLTDLMLASGIAELREIHDRGHRLGLSINLSTHDLLDIRLSTRVDDLLLDHEVPAEMLTLEITESSLLIDAPRTRQTINELHEIGVRMSIDDFGTGYSSLSYLRRLPVAELKIDRSFVANLLLDEQDEVIVRSTIDLGHNLGLEVVAEGVENNEILERLRLFGCDIAQGFCISRPLAAHHFASWLATTSHPSRNVDPLDPARWATAGTASPAASDALFGPLVP